MPGRILIFDPQVTNRLMLKSQLARDFFDVALASDAAELTDSLRFGAPDLIMMSYAAEKAAQFRNVHWAKSKANSAHIPIVFLHNSQDPTLWDAAHDCLVDDVLAYTTQRWLMAARVNMLIRGKEKIDGLIARQQAISQMGFAEAPTAYPPPVSRGVVLDVSRALALFDPEFQTAVTTGLSRDFPMLTLKTQSNQISQNRPADIAIVDEFTLGRTAAFTAICDLRKTSPSTETTILFTCDTNTPNATRALELGAQEFVPSHGSVTQMVCHLRRLIWQKQMFYRTERAVSNHLKSALIDPLTGVYNRRYAQQYLEQMVQKTERTGATLTAMILDLDRFKLVNDTYGHLTGDKVLKETAKRLARNIRSADLLSRLGGEEFLIVLSDTSPDKLRDIAERLRLAVSQHPFTCENGSQISISASIGVSNVEQSGWSNAQAVIDSADRALYRAKGGGRNCVIFGGIAA